MSIEMIQLVSWLCGAAFVLAVLGMIKYWPEKKPSAAKQQATKDNRAQVELHIERQRTLGERMIGDNDLPNRWDLLATLAMVGLILFGTFRGWW